jgi:hypothetical protein
VSGAGSPAGNERLKITAAFFNNLATVFMATGGVGPVVTFTFQVGLPRSAYWPWFLVLWMCVGAMFHLVARRVLKGLR